MPFIVTYDSKVSFDSTAEISSDYKSIKGLNAISDALGEGKAFPVNVIIKGDKELTKADVIPYLGNISKAIEKVDHVDSVMTITQPTGEKIDDLYVNSQLGSVSDGIKDAVKGIGDVQKGLSDIEKGLNQIADQTGSASKESGGSLAPAADGLAQVNQQLQLVSTQLSTTGNVQQAVPQLAAISKQLTTIQTGLQQANENLSAQQGQVGTLSDSINQLAEGVDSANDGLTKISDGLTKATGMLDNMSDSSTVRDTGIYLPAEVMKDKGFKQSIDNYSFADGKGVKLSVVLDQNPYSEEAISTVKILKKRWQAKSLIRRLSIQKLCTEGIELKCGFKRFIYNGSFTHNGYYDDWIVYCFDHFIPFNDHACIHDCFTVAYVLYSNGNLRASIRGYNGE